MAVSTLVGVGLAITLRDNFSGPAIRIGARSKELKSALQTLAAAQSQYYRTLGMTTSTLTIASYGLGRVIGAAAKYKYEMVSVGAVTQATAAQMKAMDKQALKLSQDTIFQAQDIASAMKFMGMAGIKAQDIMKSMPAVVNLAGATDTKIGGKGGAADIITNIMHTFGVASSETNNVADLLTASTVKANLNINDLGESLKYVGATARGLQVPLKDTSAAIMAISNSGIQGSMAGVALENALRYFTRSLSPSATKKQKAAMDMLGLSMSDFKDNVTGGLIPIDEIFDKLSKRMKGMDNLTKQMAITDIFGVRGQRAARILIDNPNELKQFKKDLTDSSGIAADIMKKRMETLQGHIWRVRDSLKALGIRFTESIEPLAKAILKVFNYILMGITWLMESKFGKLFLGPVVLGFIAWKVAMLGLKLAISGFNVMLAKAGVLSVEMGSSGVRSTNLMTSAITRATTAQNAFNSALATSIGLQRTQTATAAGSLASTVMMPGLGAMVTGKRMGTNIAGDPLRQGKKFGGYNRFFGGYNVVYNERTGNAINTGGAYSTVQRANGKWNVAGPGGTNNAFDTRRQAEAFYKSRMNGVATIRNEAVPLGQRGAFIVTTPGGYQKGFKGAAAAEAYATRNAGKLAGAATGLRWLKWLGPIGKALGGVLKFLTGPWGMLIISLLTFLPGIIDMVKGWFGASEDHEKTKIDLLNQMAERDRAILDGALVRTAIRLVDQNHQVLENLNTIQNKTTLSADQKKKELAAEASRLGKVEDVRLNWLNQRDAKINIAIDPALTGTMVSQGDNLGIRLGSNLINN